MSEPVTEPAPSPSVGAGTPTVGAVVVTRDRRELLGECLAAIGAQTRPVDAVLVVDNASIDGTPDLVAERFPSVELLRLDTNEGGAGGFHAGMATAHERGFEWLWLMDDDTIPTPRALEALLAALDALHDLPAPLILASKVVWTDERLHPKNLPWARLDERFGELFVSAVEHGLLLIRSASFVSILVHRDAVSRYGLPHRHYFIWGDDGEYTARVLRENPGYLVPGSLVHHKTRHKEPVHHDRLATPQYYYEVRNKLFMLRGGAWDRREKLRLASATLLGTWLWLVHARFHPRHLLVLARAVRDGLRELAE